MSPRRWPRDLERAVRALPGVADVRTSLTKRNHVRLDITTASGRSAVVHAALTPGCSRSLANTLRDAKRMVREA